MKMQIVGLRWKRAIPWSMVIFRAILAPMVVAAASLMKDPEVWLGGMIAAAFVSDVYDGILARRWGTATARLRIADSMADTAFYLAVLTAIILRHWPALQERLGLLIAVLALEAMRMGFDWMKFRRIASYHSYAAKLWGLSLAAAAFALLALNRGFWLLSLALLLGIFCDLEGLAISVVLRQSATDVKSLRSALALRRQTETLQ
jgi:CDP-diacylglycerol--glycerol-3-phosphate 3-phosphatidyltransferase